MLRIVIKDTELFDENTNRFITVKGQTLQLEHSLISISKWESKWHKPFLTQEPKTHEEELDYIKCMSIKEEPSDEVLLGLTVAQQKQISEYINDSMTATWFNDKNRHGGRSSRTITSELIYYWMVAQQIPFTCEKWHLNRLLTLVKICSIENEPKKKKGNKFSQDEFARRKALNAARRSKLNTHG